MKTFNLLRRCRKVAILTLLCFFGSLGCLKAQVIQEYPEIKLYISNTSHNVVNIHTWDRNKKKYIDFKLKPDTSIVYLTSSKLNYNWEFSLNKKKIIFPNSYFSPDGFYDIVELMILDNTTFEIYSTNLIRNEEYIFNINIGCFDYKISY